MSSRIAGVKADGDLVVWSGEFGTIDDQPADWAGVKFSQVCGTSWHLVALSEDGNVYVWNPVNTGDSAMDTPPATTSPVSEIYCGADVAALRQTDGRVVVWGEDVITPFDSDDVDNFPSIQSVGVFSFGIMIFLTEGGAIIHGNMEIADYYNDL